MPLAVLPTATASGTAVALPLALAVAQPTKLEGASRGTQAASGTLQEVKTYHYHLVRLKQLGH